MFAAEAVVVAKRMLSMHLAEAIVISPLAPTSTSAFAREFSVEEGYVRSASLVTKTLLPSGGHGFTDG